MNKQERAAFELALALGLLPGDVEDALADADAAGQALPTDEEITADAEVTAGDVERSRQWWLLQAPREFRRLLSAREAGNA